MGKITAKEPADAEAQALVKELQEYISAHFYTCTRKFCVGWGRCMPGAAALPKTLMPQAAKAPPSLPTKPSRFIAKTNKQKEPRIGVMRGFFYSSSGWFLRYIK
jgi:hypothetical protein